MSKFLNISTDTTLGGNSASDDTVSSQKAVKAYVDSQTGTAPAFANITGQPTDNANLATALAGKVPTSRTINSKALTSDITLTASDVGALPDSTVIPTVNNATLTIQKNGTTVNTFTANASSDVTANISVPTDTGDLTNNAGFITGITSSDVTTALGYTPYNSSNPSGYTSNVGTVTSVNNTQPDANGNVTISTGNYTAGTGIDITNDTISVTSPTLINTATGANSLTIAGTPATRTMSVNIGVNSYTNGTACSTIGYNAKAEAGAWYGTAIGPSTIVGKTTGTQNYPTAVGYFAQAVSSESTAIGGVTAVVGTGGIAIGYKARSWADYAIQIGNGLNSEANSFYVGTSDTHNYKLLGDDGLIPDARISSNIARASDVPTVNNATLTIQKNSTDVATFTANASSNVTANISVPTDTGDLTNNAGFITGITSSDVTTALGYTPADDSGVVKTTGNQTISGTKTFNSEIVGTLKTYQAHNNETGSLYRKMAEIVLTGNYQSVVVPFFYYKDAVNTTEVGYQGKISLRVDGTAGTLGTGNTGVVLSEYPDWINNGNVLFYVLYKNNTPESNQVTCEIWSYVKIAWDGFKMIPLSYHGYGQNKWTWYNNPTGVASLPTGYSQINQKYGKMYTVSPSEDTTSSNQIDTVGARNTKLSSYALDSSVVKISGNQTIAGTKTFTSQERLADGFMVYDTRVTKGTNPSSKIYKTIFTINDSTYNGGGTWQSMRLALGEMSIDTSGTTDFYFGIYKNEANSTNNALIHCIYDKVNNIGYATCPTPATSDNSTKIATTAFVKSNLSSKPNTSDFEVIHCVVETYQNGTDWYRVYDDGWVEQGGFYQVTTSSPHTISLLKEMSNVNYTILGIAGMGSQGDATLQISIRTDMITTTTFGVQKQWSNISGSYYWYVCGMGA